MRTIEQIYDELDQLGPGECDLTGGVAIRFREIMAEVERDHGPHAATLLKLFLHYEEEVGSCTIVNFSEIRDVIEGLSNQFRSL